jgi:hypothetical protein
VNCPRSATTNPMATGESDRLTTRGARRCKQLLELITPLRMKRGVSQQLGSRAWSKTSAVQVPME